MAGNPFLQSHPLLLVSIILTILLLPQTFASTNVIRRMPETIEPGNIIEIQFDIEKPIPSELFTLEETYPTRFTLINWTIQGLDDNITTRTQNNNFAWSFKPRETNASITAQFETPDTIPLGNYTFSAVWFDKRGFSQDQTKLEITNITKPTPSPTKKIIKTTKPTQKRKIITTKPTWKMPNIDATTAWTTGFFLGSFILVIGTYYFYRRTE